MTTELETVEGMQFDRGYLSPYFVTDPEKMKAVLSNPLILIHEKKISAMNDMLPLLEQVVKMGRELLILSEDIEGEALATLVVNKLRGTIKVAAVKAPGFGDRRKEMLKDIAVLTGGTAFMEDLGPEARDRHDPRSGHGEARRDRQGQHRRSSTAPATRRPSRAASIQIRKQIADTTSDYDREKLQERLAKLAGGVAVVKVGAHTETEMKEKKARVEDALHATRAAVEEGIVPGGGVALIRATRRARQAQVRGRARPRREAHPPRGGGAPPQHLGERGRRGLGRGREGARRQGRLRLQRRHRHLRGPARRRRHRSGQGRAPRAR